MNVSEFEQILDSCLARLQSGETVEACLADHPEKAVELRPLLAAGLAVRTSPIPAASPQAVERGEALMLAALAGREEKAAVSFGTLRRYAERILSVLMQEEASQMRVAFRSIVTTVLFFLVAGFFALTISANSLPGEPFYPVKRGWESLRVGLTFDGDARQRLVSQIQENRRDELAALIALGRQTQVVYEGFVEQIDEDRIVVDGFEFETNMDTQWLVEPEVGEAVRIETEITEEGELVALEISAGSLDIQPQIILTASPTPCNTPACVPPSVTPTPCNGGGCGTASPTPVPSSTKDGPTPTPCNTPVCGTITATATPCNTGSCGTASPTPIPSSTSNGPTPTPCNDPACSPPTATATPCNAGACGGPSPTPPPTSTSDTPNPTSTPCNTPVCGPATSTPTPCTIGCGNPSPTPVPSSTPCNSPACSPPTPTPPPTDSPGNPTPTPCNSPACSPPSPTPTVCNTGACGDPTPTPIPSGTPCNSPACLNQGAIPPNESS